MSGLKQVYMQSNEKKKTRFLFNYTSFLNDS